MNRKEAMDVLLSKVPADKKEAFVADLRAATDRKERSAVIKKYGAKLTEDEEKIIRDARGNAVSDSDLDNAVGGCCHGNCYCSIPCGRS